MPVLVLAVTAAVVAAVVTGGDLARVADRCWRWPLLTFAALGVQVGLEVGPRLPRASTFGLTLLLLSYLMLLAFCAANLRHRGMAVVALGIALNAAVIAVDGGMPARAPRGSVLTSTVKHHPLESSDRLGALGDVIVLGPLHQTVSIGDLTMMAGIVATVIYASRRGRRFSARDRHLVRLHERAMERLHQVDLGEDVLERRQHARVVDVARS